MVEYAIVVSDNVPHPDAAVDIWHPAAVSGSVQRSQSSTSHRWALDVGNIDGLRLSQRQFRDAVISRGPAYRTPVDAHGNSHAPQHRISQGIAARNRRAAIGRGWMTQHDSASPVQNERRL